MLKKKDKKDSSNSTMPLTQATPTQRRTYQFKDLSPTLAKKLESGYLQSFQILIRKTESEPVLSESLKAEIGSMMAQFEVLLNLLNTDEKLKNFEDDIFNTAYFQANYGLWVAVLALKLGDKEKAKASLHRSLQSPHSRIIKNFVVMRQNELIKEEEQELLIGYMFNIIKYSNVSVGNSKERAQREQEYESLGRGNKHKLLGDFSNDVFDFYLSINNTKKIEELLSILAASDTLKECGNTLLKQYLSHYLKQSDIEEIDRVLIQFKPLLNANLYLILVEALAKKSYLGEPYQTRFSDYLEKGLALADIDDQLKFAELLIMEADIPKVTKGLELVKKVQQSIKTKGKTFDKIRGQCFYLIGVIYISGLLPHHPQYKFNIQLAVENLTKAINYNDQNANAYHLLGLLYKEGVGGIQDLSLASSYFHKALKLNKLLAHLELAEVQLMQTATLAQEGERDALLLKARDDLQQLVSINENTLKALTDIGKIHTKLALIYLFLDFNLKLKVDESTRIISLGFSCIPLYGSPVKTTHAREVEFHLRTAYEHGDLYAASLIGMLLHHGTYLKQDLESAEIFYKACKAEEVSEETIKIQLLELYLLKMTRTTHKKEQETYLLIALNLHSSLLKTADEELASILAVSFEKLIQIYKGHVYTPAELSFMQNTYKKHRQSTEFQLFDRKTLGPRLRLAIDSVLPHLQSQSIKPDVVVELLKSFHNLSLILKKSKSEVPAYLSELQRLPELEIALPYYLQLPKKVQIALIHNYANWPLVQEPEGFIKQLVSFIKPQDLDEFEKVQLALILTHFGYEGGLLEDDLVPLLVDLLKSNPYNNVSQVAQLLYLYAILHANGSLHPLQNYVTLAIKLLHPLIIASLQTHCWDANEESMSQIYHGLNYLKQFYPEELVIAPDSTLSEFINFYEKLLSSDKAVTVSIKQQEVFNLLSSLNSDFQHESLVGGRRVDYYNSKTKEVVFFHGPSHYHYSKEGLPIQINAATVLNEKTLEAQGFKVISIPYNRWDESLDKTALLAELIPSLRHIVQKESKDTVVRIHTTQIKQGQSPDSFWKNLNRQALLAPELRLPAEHKA